MDLGALFTKMWHHEDMEALFATYEDVCLIATAVVTVYNRITTQGCIPGCTSASTRRRGYVSSTTQLPRQGKGRLTPTAKSVPNSTGHEDGANAPKMLLLPPLAHIRRNNGPGILGLGTKTMTMTRKRTSRLDKINGATPDTRDTTTAIAGTALQ